MLTTRRFLTITATIIALSAAMTTSAALAASPSIVFTRSSARLFRKPFTRTYVWSGLAISGTVYDNGAPVANQIVTATSNDGPGAQAITDVTGRFTLELPRGGSRLVRITTGAPAPVTLDERVTATMTLNVRALNGYRLVFTGWILTSWQRDEGLPWVIIQDQTPVGWSTIGAACVGAGGRYRVSYQALPGDAGASFAFRAITGPGPTWLAGSTDTHWATVW